MTSEGDASPSVRRGPLTGRRLLALLVVLSVIGLPAGILRGLCAGESCKKAGDVSSAVPFCSLSDRLRELVGHGFRSGRSADVLGVTAHPVFAGGTGPYNTDVRALWTSLDAAPQARVPIVFSGTGVNRMQLPSGTGLDDVAATEAGILGFHRPHPEVRTGSAVPGVASGEMPKLILEVVWKGVGSRELEANRAAWPTLAGMVRTGAGTLDGDAGSLPLDPTAILTTIGTGGLPYQHGVTGTLVRNGSGALVNAWSPRAEPSVIATLGDDYDQRMQQRPRIGLAATESTDRGLIGGDWYIDVDNDDVSFTDVRKVVPTATRTLASGYGSDAVPDIMAVVLRGPLGRMDAQLEELSRVARGAASGSVATVVTATGSTTPPAGGARSPASVVRRVEADVHGEPRVIQAATPGGLFLDQRTLARREIPPDVVLTALTDVRDPDERSVMAQVFPAIAVSFARYC